MASIIVILGSILGFVAALVGWLGLGLPFLAALAIWIAAGPVSAGLVAMTGLIPQGRRPAADPVLVKI